MNVGLGEKKLNVVGLGQNVVWVNKDECCCIGSKCCLGEKKLNVVGLGQSVVWVKKS